MSALPPKSLACSLEYCDPPGFSLENRSPVSSETIAVNECRESQMSSHDLNLCRNHLHLLNISAYAGNISIGDAVNLAILEEMAQDCTVIIHAEDLQSGSSYNIPKLTQQTFGRLRASDEIISEGHFIGKAIGESLNGYRPIVELMNTNFGIYGMAELSSAGNTYATSGCQFTVPLTIIGAGGTAPNQALGAEHSQPYHAYIMGIPGIRICTAASPDTAYGLAKAMVRDNGPGLLILPVKMMKDTKGRVAVGHCLPLDKAALLHEASDEAVKLR